MASEIRVNKINSRTGVGTITLSPTGVDFTGIATVATLKATTGIVTTLSVTGTTTLNGNLDLQDDDKILIGTGDDLQIYHNGSHSYIADEGSGELIISGSRIQLMNAARGEKAIDFVQDGAVDIYYDGSRKFSTKSDGIDVTGEVQCDSVDVDGGHINLESGYSLQWGDSHERIEQSDSTLEFFTNNGQQMTLSGSNLGLGTNSNLNGLLTLHQDDDQLFLKQTDGDSGFLLGSNNTNGNLNLKRRSVGSNTTIATFLAAGGLTFNGDTAAANALNDYEEGTWTASVKTTNNNQTLSAGNTTGYYVKVGKMVTAYYYTGVLNITAAGTGSAIVQGLPYSVANLNQGYAVGTVTHATCFANQVQNCYADPNQDRVVFIQEGSTSGLSFTTGSTLYLMLSITYRSGI